MDHGQQPVALGTISETIEAIADSLRNYARQKDVYIPRVTELATAVYQDVVHPLIQATIVEVGQTLPLTVDPSNGNVVYCHDEAAHDTHIWTTPWAPTIPVRCPGKD